MGDILGVVTAHLSLKKQWDSWPKHNLDPTFCSANSNKPVIGEHFEFPFGKKENTFNL